MKYSRNQTGFTLIELMIATLVFSVILLGATTATIQIGRMYYKGIIMSRTQETSRRIMDDIARPIQFAGSDVLEKDPVQLGGIQTGVVCIGDRRFTYGINVQVSDDAATGSYTNHRAKHALWNDTLRATATAATCVPLDLKQPQPSDVNSDASRPGRELLGQGMRLARFNVSGSGNIWNIDSVVIYGDDDLLTPDGDNPVACAGLVQNSQWCATSALSTQVYKRINPELN